MRVTVHVTSSCGNDGDRTHGEAIDTVEWSIDADENGLEWLTLAHTDGSFEQYHRRER